MAGGMLRVGVPEYRLPTAIIEREVADILDLGIELRLNTRVDDLDRALRRGLRRRPDRRRRPRRASACRSPAPTWTAC